MNSASQYDVVVVGAGPAGSAASYFLSKGGLKVALLDKFDFPRDKTCGDGLTPRAVKVLEIMGVLPQIEPHAYHCSGITLRYSDSITYRLELSHLENLPRQILILPRLSLDDILRQHAVASGAVFMPRSHVAGLGVFLSYPGGRGKHAPAASGWASQAGAAREPGGTGLF